MDEADAPLREAWYYALPSRLLRRGMRLAKTMLDEPILLGRDRDGIPFALRDLCPHRGMPLSAGNFDGSEIECCYHGWRFSTDGQCTAIPSLVAGQQFDLARVAVPQYPVREVQGNVWVYFGDDPTAAPAVPLVPGFDDRIAPKLVARVISVAGFDPTVIGLLDPAHGPFVHRSWWWRPARSFYEKTKQFAPSPLGFTMLRHASSTNSRAYRLIGGAPETEISFTLPAVRIDHTRAGRHTIANLTTITPLEGNLSEINHCIYWRAPWLSVLKPVLHLFVRAFLRQDRDIMARQQQGLRFNPVLSLIDDADTQVRWYYRLKQEYRRAAAEGRAFANPVGSHTLRWRS